MPYNVDTGKMERSSKVSIDNTVEALIIAFIIISVVSIFGSVLMFVVKDPRKQAIIFYVLAIWGMVLAWQHVLGLETQNIGAQLGAWGFGSLSAVAMLVDLCAKSDKKFWISRLMVLSSVLLGILGIFIL